MSTDKGRIGKLPPRYSFILNPYADERISRCPRCQKLTHPRKFALFIHVTSWGPLTLGKTCVYCSPCELIVVHQHDLEAELAHAFCQLAPEVVGNEYLVLGTMDRQTWKAGLTGADQQMDEMLMHTADFKKVLKLEVDPGGWGPVKPSQARSSRSRRRPEGYREELASPRGAHPVKPDA
jgi:hypothetical protein